MTRFPSGQIVITPGSLAALPAGVVQTALSRHLSGDWGEVDKHDAAENELSLQQGFRLLSVYRNGDGRKFWIITEADRSVTTILLPEEY